MTHPVPDTSSDSALRQILQTCRTLAVVGLSPKEDRPSYEVAHYLQARGYRIVPVNPAAVGAEILGERVYASVREADVAIRAEGGRIDLVDVFRKSEDVPPIADDAIAIGARTLWLQLGVVNDAAIARARAAGLAAVQDRCPKIE
ncbi:MAG: CoA-binding protein, partial [Burkholderiaceae bacterium]|nr:CoA-binding protein [Burkholderiaceae bacterium]